ncbi:hypothetical protein [Metamycoplasma gateae]|uniref:Lipoprotein-associated type-17 domain-containing protein n=1 Tax=Metamycoplasma gateae TaxID=35769 RepID=A0ABZ2AH24_9BACT|nr:hypothetical protein V2E26_02915 [Metamycoplasma gateae]
MKKTWKYLLPLASFSAVPVVAISCSDPTPQKTAIEKEFEKINKLIKEDNTLSASVKVKLSGEISKARLEINKVEKDEDIKPILNKFIANVALILLNKEDQSGDPSSSNEASSKEDQIANQLKNIFVISETNKEENAKKLLQKQVKIWFERKNKVIIETDKNAKPDFNNPSTIFTITNSDVLGSTQLVNAVKPTYVNSRQQTKLSSQLDYEIKIKSQTDNAEGNTKTVEFDVIVEYKVATYSNSGEHEISKVKNTSTISLSATVDKNTSLDSSSSSTTEEGTTTTEADPEIKAIDDWAETTKNQLELNSAVDKEDLKTRLKEKSYDLYFSYKTFKVAKVAKGAHPQWKELTDSDFVLNPKSGFEWQPGGKQYQIAHPTNSTYKRKNFTNINTQLDYEVKEEGGKFILVLKYKGALFIKGQQPKIGTKTISWELEIA